MNRYRAWIFPVPLALWLFFGCGGEFPPAQRGLAGGASGWNLLLLTVDTVRADRLGAYGYRLHPTSPWIDALLESGVRFERAMAPRALTWPSLASVLTGLYPSGHGILANGYALPEDLQTLPKILGGEGYQTGAFLSNMCHANHRGWDAFYCGRGKDGKVRDRALEWATATDAERPFFLWVHYFGSHPPYYNGGQKARQELDPGYAGELEPTKEALDRVMQEDIRLSARDLRHLNALYDAAVIGTDHLVGTLLDELEAAGKLERTLVVFLADHGEELYQHNRYLYHACSVYQTTLHVPLGFRAPELVPHNSSVRQTVELIDVLPTILELLDVPQPPDLHGASLVGYLEQPARSGDGKPAFSEYDTTRIRTVLAGEWKLIENPDGITPHCFAGGPKDLYPIAATELYNLAEDPYETTNLAASNPSRAAELKRLIRQRFASLPSRTERQEIPPELKKELEALGYVAN